VRHAQFEDVASRIKRTEYRFDPDNPYFRLGASWTTCIRPSLGSVIFLHIADFLEIWPEHTPLYYSTRPRVDFRILWKSWLSSILAM
jgi:hypothetical protein